MLRENFSSQRIKSPEKKIYIDRSNNKSFLEEQRSIINEKEVKKGG